MNLDNLSKIRYIPDVLFFVVKDTFSNLEIIVSDREKNLLNEYEVSPSCIEPLKYLGDGLILFAQPTSASTHRFEIKCPLLKLPTTIVDKLEENYTNQDIVKVTEELKPKGFPKGIFDKIRGKISNLPPPLKDLSIYDKPNSIPFEEFYNLLMSDELLDFIYVDRETDKTKKIGHSGHLKGKTIDEVANYVENSRLGFSKFKTKDEDKDTGVLISEAKFSTDVVYIPDPNIPKLIKTQATWIDNRRFIGSSPHYRIRLEIYTKENFYTIQFNTSSIKGGSGDWFNYCDRIYLSTKARFNEIFNNYSYFSAQLSQKFI